MAVQQTLIVALVALAAVQTVSAWNSGRATFYGKDGW
jgi:hypothetical protein